MRISWSSRKGQQRHYNSDAVALGYTGPYLVVVIVDAAERAVEGRLRVGINSQGKRLATYWADSCLAAMLKAHREADQELGTVLITEEPLLALLSQQQKALRLDYLHDIASYGVLILNTETGAMRWWYTGDCRIGLRNQGGVIEWLNVPHRLENSPLLQAWQATESAALVMNEQEAAKHTLTQSLNARRFTRPTLVNAQLPVKAMAVGSTPDAAIVLATDGYWCEHLRHGTATAELEDDASVLTLTPGKRSLTLQIDTPNLLITYPK